MFKSNSIQTRKYHVYKIANNVLTIFEADMSLKKQVNNTFIDKSLNKKMLPSSIFKEIRKSKPLQQGQEIEKILQASSNIKRLCKDAYDLCQSVDMDEARYEPIDDELFDFIELTNEMYPCIDKELYRKIKEMKLNQN